MHSTVSQALVPARAVIARHGTDPAVLPPSALRQKIVHSVLAFLSEGRFGSPVISGGAGLTVSGCVATTGSATATGQNDADVDISERDNEDGNLSA